MANKTNKHGSISIVNDKQRNKKLFESVLHFAENGKIWMINIDFIISKA